MAAAAVAAAADAPTAATAPALGGAPARAAAAVAASPSGCDQAAACPSPPQPLTPPCASSSSPDHFPLRPLVFSPWPKAGVGGGGGCTTMTGMGKGWGGCASLIAHVLLVLLSLTTPALGGAGESASPWSATALQVRSPGFFVSLGRHPSPYLSYAPESDGDPIATGARGAPESVVDPTVSCWLPPTGRTYGPVHGRAPSLGSLSFLMEVSIHTPMGSRTRGVGAPLLVPKVPLVGLIPTCRGTGPHLHMSWHGAVLHAAVGRGAGTVSQAIPTLPKPAYKSGRRGGRSGSARPAPSTCQQQHKVCRPTSHHSFDPALSPRPRPTAPTTRHP